MEKSVGSCEPRQRWGLNGYLVYFFGGGVRQGCRGSVGTCDLFQVPFIPKTFCPADLGVGKPG